MGSINHYPGFENAGSITPQELIAGDYPIARKNVTLKGGAAYVRGTVLQEGTTTDVGKFSAVTTDANAAFILLEDRDATAGDLTAVVAMTGEFNKHALTLGVGATLAGITAALEAKNIYIRDAVRA